MKNENEETQFLQKLSDQKGIPIWKNSRTFKNKSLTNKNSGSSKTIIPLSDNDKNLSSLLFVDSKPNGKATIYTITNEQLFKIVNNTEIPKETRETILMEFLYFDNLSFGERKYSNIPVDLFLNIKAKKGKNYKQFKIKINDTEKSSSATSRQVSDICVTFYHCYANVANCTDVGCSSTRCYSYGSSTAPSNFGSSEGGSGDSGSTSGGSGGASTSNEPWYLMNPDIDIYKYPSNIRNIFKRLTDYDVILQRQQLDYLKTNTVLIQKLETFLTNNNLEKSEFANITIDVFMDNGDKVFFNWAIDYLTQNPNVTVSQFQNWFMGTSEGQDGDYDATYWEDPNLTFQKQNLPTLSKFLDAYPKNLDGKTYMLGKDLYPLVGDDVYKAYLDFPNLVNGSCALKVSRALNYSDIIIPKTPNTLKGKDGKYYFVNAKALNKWMRLTFGTDKNNPNYRNFTKNQGGNKGDNFPNLVKGLKGIYSMVSPLEIKDSWASGHADIIYDGICPFYCHFYDEKLQIVPIEYIDIWILN